MRTIVERENQKNKCKYRMPGMDRPADEGSFQKMVTGGGALSIFLRGNLLGEEKTPTEKKPGRQ